MFFVPAWITNFLLLITCWVLGFQLWRRQLPNPLTNIQFVMIVFCMMMVLAVALYNRVNPWLSLVFFLIAVAALGLMIRQFRKLPPMKLLK
jgi:Ca2+/Na+ antiporter